MRIASLHMKHGPELSPYSIVLDSSAVSLFHRIPIEIIGKKTSWPHDPSNAVSSATLATVCIYGLWDPIRQKFFVSWDVLFKEDEFLDISAFSPFASSLEPLQTPHCDVLDDEHPDLNDFAIHPNNSTLAPVSPLASPV